MKKPARKSRRGQEAVGQAPLPLTLVLRRKLQEFVVAMGLIALETLLEEERAAVCGSRYRVRLVEARTRASMTGCEDR